MTTPRALIVEDEAAIRLALSGLLRREGYEVDQAETGEALDHAAPRIQRAVGRQVRLKYNPKLRFLVDEAVERGLRMNELLRELTADSATLPSRSMRMRSSPSPCRPRRLTGGG